MINPREYKDHKVPVFSTKDVVQDSINIVKKRNLNHIIIVNDKEQLLGVVSIKTIPEEFYNKTLGELPKSIIKNYYVYEESHLYEALSIMYNYSLEFIPIVNNEEEKKLLGVLDKTKMFGILIRLTKAHIPGSTIILHIPKNEYSLTHIASIIESENVKIISVFSQYDEREEIYLITIKVDVEDPSRVIASLERMGYIVHYYTASADNTVNNIDDRIKAFIKFLNT